MCFTPTVSLTTALIEFAVATSILVFYRKSIINKLFAIFVYFLGAYQFSEFMLCTSVNTMFWAKVGFIIYTFMPALVLYIAIRTLLKKDYKLLFAFPLIFSLIAIFTKDFILKTSCGSFFVEVKTLFFYNFIEPLFSSLYIGVYYIGFILVSCIIIWKKIIRERNEIKKELEISILATILIASIPALILLIILPALNYKIASIYCQFAFLFAIGALIVAHLDARLQKKKQSF